jgi:hypothetical protein
MSFINLFTIIHEQYILTAIKFELLLPFYPYVANHAKIFYGHLALTKFLQEKRLFIYPIKMNGILY